MSSSRKSFRACLEMLEQRRLLSTGLTPVDDGFEFKAPSIILPGTSQSARLEVTNTSGQTVQASLPITVYVSDQASLDSGNSNQLAILTIDPTLKVKNGKTKRVPIHFTMPAKFVTGTCYILVTAGDQVYSSTAMYNPSAGYDSSAVYASVPATPNDSSEYLYTGTWTANGQTNDLSLNLRSLSDGSIYADVLAAGNFGQVSILSLPAHISRMGLLKIHGSNVSASIYPPGSSSGGTSSGSQSSEQFRIAIIGHINSGFAGEVGGSSIHLSSINPASTTGSTSTGQTSGNSSGYTRIVGKGRFAVWMDDQAPTVYAGSDQVGRTLSDTGYFTANNAGNNWTASVDYGDGSGIQPLTLNSNDTFSLSHHYVTDGAYTVTVDITDMAGNVGSGSFVFTADSTAPTLTIDQTQNIYTDSNASTTITGTYSDANPSTSGVTVIISNGLGQTWDFVATVNASDGTWSTTNISDAGLADGTYSISATATDAAGNSANTNTAAELVIADAPPSTVNIAQLPTTVNSDFTMTGTYPNPPYVGTVTVTLTNSQGNPLTPFTVYTVNNARKTWSVPISIAGVPDGIYTVTATETDTGWVTTIPGSGNLTVSTIGSEVQFDPSQLPLVTNTNQTLAGTYDGTDVYGGTITAITVDLTDASGNSTTFAATLNPANHTWSAPVNITGLDGVYTVTATATDSAGNAGTLAAPGTFTVDNVSNTLGSDVDFTTSGNAQELVTLGTATDFTLTFSGQTTTDITNQGTPGEMATTILNALEALNNVGTGNVSVLAESSTKFLVTFVGSMAGKPQPTMTSSDTTATVTVQPSADQWPVITTGNITLHGTYTNPDGQGGPDGDGNTITAIMINLIDSEGNVKTFPASLNDGNWSAPINGDGLADGTYTVTATIFDSNGNTGTKAAPATFTKVDLRFTTGQLPLTTDTSSDQTLTGAYAIKDFYGQSVTGITIYLVDSQNNATAFAAILSNRDGVWSWSADVPPDSLPVGVYTVEAVIADAAGNHLTAISPGTFTVN